MHVLSTPPAFVLSQNQTLRKENDFGQNLTNRLIERSPRIKSSLDGSRTETCWFCPRAPLSVMRNAQINLLFFSDPGKSATPESSSCWYSKNKSRRQKSRPQSQSRVQTSPTLKSRDRRLNLAASGVSDQWRDTSICSLTVNPFRKVFYQFFPLSSKGMLNF